jgi:hypothetical protein
VLLDPVLNPGAVWQFEAIMVLLSGFWPARGLLSGAWPPLGGMDAPPPSKSFAGDPSGDDPFSDSSLPQGSPGSSYDRMRTPRSSRYKTRWAFAS